MLSSPGQRPTLSSNASYVAGALGFTRYDPITRELETRKAEPEATAERKRAHAQELQRLTAEVEKAQQLLAALEQRKQGAASRIETSRQTVLTLAQSVGSAYAGNDHGHQTATCYASIAALAAPIDYAPRVKEFLQNKLVTAQLNLKEAQRNSPK